MRSFILLVFLVLAVAGSYWLWQRQGIGRCIDEGLQWDYRTGDCI